MSTWVTDLSFIAVRYEGEIDYSGSDGPRLQALVDEAEAVLADRLPQLAARISAGLTTVAAVRLVVRAAVLRAWRNPAGLASESAGEVSLRSGVLVSSMIAYTPDELAFASGANGRRGSRTIQTRPPQPWQDVP